MQILESAGAAVTTFWHNGGMNSVRAISLPPRIGYPNGEGRRERDSEARTVIPGPDISKRY